MTEEKKPMTGEIIRLHERIPDEREALDYIEWSAAAQVSKAMEKSMKATETLSQSQRAIGKLAFALCAATSLLAQPDEPAWTAVRYTGLPGGNLATDDDPGKIRLGVDVEVPLRSQHNRGTGPMSPIPSIRVA